MSLEREIIQLLESFRDIYCGGKAKKAAEYLGVPPSTFSRWITGANLPKVETLIIPFERMNARIIVTGNSGENEILERKCHELEMEIECLQKILETKEELIQLQKDFISTLKYEAVEKKEDENKELSKIEIESSILPSRIDENGAANKD